MTFSNILWLWVLAASLYGGVCEADKYTKEWVQKYPSSASVYTLNGVLFANDVFVAYGQTIVFSADGETWVRKVEATAFNKKLRAATYAGNNRFIVMGALDDGQVFVSNNGGVDWTGGANIQIIANAVAFGDGQYITGGESLSKKATSSVQLNSNWSPVDGPTGVVDWKIYDIIYTDKFVGCGNGIFTLESGGSSWSRKELSTTKTLRAIAYGNGIYVAVGDQGTIVRSTDSSTWTDQSLTVTNPKGLWGVAFGLNKFVAVESDGKMHASKDGITWTAQTNSPATISLWDPGFSNHLAFGKGRFVVVGSSDAIYVALDNCSAPCDSCSECSTDGDCTSINCLWDGSSCVEGCSSSECSSCPSTYSCSSKGNACLWDGSSCVEGCSSSECSSCPSTYSCSSKGDACTWDGSCLTPKKGGSVVFHSHWAWCLMIYLSIIILH